MALTPRKTVQMRNKIHKLSPDCFVEDRTHYEKLRFEYIKASEGLRTKSYKDSLGYVTVGVGFNMDSPNAKKTWAVAFEHVKKAPCFDGVYIGKNIEG